MYTDEMLAKKAEVVIRGVDRSHCNIYFEATPYCPSSFFELGRITRVQLGQPLLRLTVVGQDGVDFAVKAIEEYIEFAGQVQMTATAPSDLADLIKLLKDSIIIPANKGIMISILQDETPEKVEAPKMEKKVGLTYASEMTRYIWFDTDAETAENFKQFGHVRVWCENRQNHYTLNVDGRFDFDKVVEYVENYTGN